jgi:glucosamine--fructose-6-phosphate aminotransferase (isomerizing)
MNLNDQKYSQFSLVHEMFDSVELVRQFDVNRTKALAEDLKSHKKFLLAGEGSSRLFPANNLVRQAHKNKTDLSFFTEGSHQAMEYDLEQYAVFCASNSGQTSEVIHLAKKLTAIQHPHFYGLTANENSLLHAECTDTFVLHCGKEKAVAATKSVIEQALFYHSLLWNLTGRDGASQLPHLADAMYTALSLEIDPEIIDKASQAPTIYFAGYNDGVAEEITIKTNEIPRLKSDFLEGTYAVHGIEEVMTKDEVVFIIDPIDAEIDKFQKELADGVGVSVFAIADRDTPFPTIKVPNAGEMTPYVYLAAGWNLLVKIGLKRGINLDKPERARKVGNAFVG